MTIDIRRVHFTHEAFAPLLAEAEEHGGPFLLRLRDEWLSGATRFSHPGEFLFGAYADVGLVAIGGVSRDPYDPEPGLGRVRHVYVSQAHRRKGIGRMLVARIVSEARGRFTRLRLRTRSDGAAHLYEALGFVPSGLPNETHRLVF